MPVALSPPVQIVASVLAADFDLRRIKSAKPCAAAGKDEIVVCGRASDRGRDRVVELPDARFAAKPVRAEIGLGGAVTGGVHMDRQDFGRDVSNRILVGIKAPF